MSKNRPKKKESTTCIKKTFNLLCSCLNSDSTESLGEEIYPLQHDRDRYEYIVEKLAIKRIPLSLFATSEDYKRLSSCYNKKTQELLPGKKVNYHSYFVKTSSSSPKSTGRPKIQSSSSNISVNYEKRMRPMVRMREPSQISRTREQEQEMVSHILNQYSSLYTLDNKEAIPKDPLTFPRQPRWHSPNCPTKMKPKKEIPKIPFRPNRSVVEAEIFEASNKALPVTANNVSMSHSMQQTIRALGTAQPYAKHFLPRNHRHCSPAERDEITESFVPKRVQSEELRCVQLDKEANMVIHKCQHKKVEKVIGDNVKQKLNVVQKTKTDSSSKHSMTSRKEYAPKKEHHFMDHPCLYYTTDSPSALIPKVIEEESHVAVLPSNFSLNSKRHPLSESDPRSYTTINRDFGNSYNGEDPVMEINHMKGSNLKWKIIIKHHDG